MVQQGRGVQRPLGEQRQHGALLGAGLGRWGPGDMGGRRIFVFSGGGGGALPVACELWLGVDYVFFGWEMKRKNPPFVAGYVP